MEDRRFDRLARLLGGASTRRGALAALLALAGGDALGAGAKRGRKRCDPPCPAGQTCRKGACACTGGGAVCGGACCAPGQTCQAAACVTPPPQCLAFGAACKNAGAPCCDGLVCGSGQGGMADVACFVPAGGPCRSTADCVYDSVCADGVCVAIPRPTPTPPGPTCAPSFPATDDPSANGLALQAAVAAAAVGATIVLAPGEYSPAHLPARRAYLMIERSITLKTCVPGRSAVIRCPWTPTGTSCVRVVDADVTMDGIDLTGIPNQSFLTNYGASVSTSASERASLAFRNGVVSGFVFGLSSSAATIGTIGGGVTIAGCGTGLNTTNWSCSAPVTWGQPPVANDANCVSGAPPACGC